MQINEVPTEKVPRLSVRLACSEHEIQAAQRLRWQVFVEEQGARIVSPRAGLDIDEFDDYCEHLVVIDEVHDAVIGTYRLLTAEAAARVGRYYSEKEFDLSAIRQPGVRLLELGRSCVLPAYRSGSTIALLWSGVADFLVDTRHDALIGCASISLKRHPAAAARLARELCRTHRAPTDLLVMPRRALPHGDGATDEQAAQLPPLLKGYLRSGAVVCGEPCWDPDFDCADLLLYLSLDRLVARYARRFLPGRDGDRGREVSSPCHTTAV